jgi:YHS domain-containing protein
MMRYLILAIAFYILYRIVRGMLGTRRKEHDQAGNGTVEELVQDAHCKVYVPRRDSVQRTIEGKKYFFCSEECARKYEMESHRQ